MSLSFKRFFTIACHLLILLFIFSSCSEKSKGSSVVTDDIKINEVMSSNNYYAQLPDGSCCDWVEFYNSSDKAVNLKGAMLSDSASTADSWSFPTDFILEPGGYGIIYLSGLNTVDENGNIHTNFKLSSKGETLVFSNSAGALIQQLNIPKCEMSNISYGLDNEAPDDNNYYWFASPSPGKANSGSKAVDINELDFPKSGIVINEYMSKNTYTIYDSNNQYSDWIELYNPSDVDVRLSGFALSDTDKGGRKWFFPDNTVITAKGYLIVFCSDTLPADSSELHADFSLGAGDVITLYSIAGLIEDSVKVTELNPNVSCGRDQNGEFKLFASPTPGRGNDTYAYDLTTKLTASPYSSLYISEVMCVSGNDGSWKNDFIEIHNAAKKAISLKGYGLSKDSAKAAFTFPDIQIESGGYVVVYCSGKNVSVAGRTLQSAFKLNQGGEEVFLFDSGSHIIDSINSGKQTYGRSSGRLQSEKNKVYVFGTPTPGKPNDESKKYPGYAPMPQISSAGGYVKAGTKVTITAPEGCNIYYTTTGKDPTSSSTKYTKEITINKTTVIKAIATKKGYLSSQVVYSTFLVEKEHSIPVVSVSADDQGLFSAYHGIMSSFVGGLVPGKPNYTSTEERQVSFEYYVDGKKAASFNSMARVFGETSREAPQKSLALLLSERCGANETHFPFFGDNSVDVFSSFVLRPSGQDWRFAHMRDELCALIARDSVVNDYMEFQPVALYINGKYWGLYYLREKLNEDYLVNKYGMTKGKIDIVKWERKQQAGNRDDYLALCDFCENNDLTVKKNYDYVCSQVDIDSLIDWWVFETYVANNDTGNIRCYRDQKDGKWRWMLFDLDYAFTLSTYENNYIKRYMLGPYHGLAQCNNSIPRNLLKNQDFRDKFITAYCRHLKTTFDPDRVIKLMDTLSSSIKDEMPRQEKRWGQPTVSYWNYNKKIIKNIINKKPEIAKKQLKEAFKLSEKEFQEYYKNA